MSPPGSSTEMDQRRENGNDGISPSRPSDRPTRVRYVRRQRARAQRRLTERATIRRGGASAWTNCDYRPGVSLQWSMHNRLRLLLLLLALAWPPFTVAAHTTRPADGLWVNDYHDAAARSI